MGRGDHAVSHDRLRVSRQRRGRLVAPANPHGRVRRAVAAATLRQFLEVVVELVEIATCFLLAALAWPVVSMLAELDQRSQAANFPLVIPQATMPIGFVLMGLSDRSRPLSRETRMPAKRPIDSDH